MAARLPDPREMKKVLTHVLAVGIALALLIMGVEADRFRMPGDQRGYEPEQPIAFSHRLHAGELGIDCQYCHTGAERSRYAGVPAASTCMNCHRYIVAPWGAVRAEDRLAAEENRLPRPVVSPEIEKIYAAMGLGEDGQRDPAVPQRPILWNRVHRLADFVYFDHRPHVNAGVACQTCHGPVETMETMRQESSLSMGWCVNCHRDANRTGVSGKAVHASIDCTTCHF